VVIIGTVLWRDVRPLSNSGRDLVCSVEGIGSLVSNLGGDLLPRGVRVITRYLFSDNGRPAVRKPISGRICHSVRLVAVGVPLNSHAVTPPAQNVASDR
jgi:hypothetical protein